jgi:hypothetical protein
VAARKQQSYPATPRGKRWVACVVASSDFEDAIDIADRIVVMSDSAGVTDVPRPPVDIEKLAMPAAQRSSTERRLYRGIAVWIGVGTLADLISGVIIIYAAGRSVWSCSA